METEPETEVAPEEAWAGLDRIRDDMRYRARQLEHIRSRLVELGRGIDDLAFEVAEIENESRAAGPRRGRRRRSGPPKGPSVVDVAVQVLAERGGPVPCEELARAIRARGIDSGNNERSLRMSAGKGRRLRGLDDDYITLA